jgi:hypothetical protein
MHEQSAPRWITLVIGIWLFLSAFIWPHTEPQFVNTLVVGAVSAIAAAVAMRVPQFRYVNLVAAIWLFVSTWGFPVMSRGTLWNNVIAAVLMLIVSMQPSHRQPAYR